jgi:hypothetical protein
MFLTYNTLISNPKHLRSALVKQVSCTPTSTLGPKYGIYKLLQVAAGQDLDIKLKRFEQLLSGLGNNTLLVSQLRNSHNPLVHSWHLLKGKYKETLLQLITVITTGKLKMNSGIFGLLPT